MISKKTFNEMGLVAPEPAMTPNACFYVCSSNGSNGNPGTKDRPFGTIDSAIGRCTANKGDVIYVLPGHTETVAAAGGITADIAGISIIGLGNGSDRPTISLSAVASTIVVSAANVTFKNLIVNAGVAEVDIAFHITGANCTLDGICSYPVSTYSMECFVLTTATADDLCIKNCYLLQTTAPTAASHFIHLVGVDRGRILDNTIQATLKNDAAATVLGGGTTASTVLLIKGNNLIMVGGTTQLSVVLLYTASTGLMTGNSLAASLTTLAGMNNPAALWCNENYCTKAVSKHGILDPVVS